MRKWKDKKNQAQISICPRCGARLVPTVSSSHIMSCPHCKDLFENRCGLIARPLDDKYIRYFYF